LRKRAGSEICKNSEEVSRALSPPMMCGFGLKPCIWEGWKAFKRYVALSVVTFNLRKISAIENFPNLVNSSEISKV